MAPLVSQRYGWIIGYLEDRVYEAASHEYRPLSTVARIPFHARILAIECVDVAPCTPSQGSDRILILTDHPIPRLIVLRRATAADHTDPTLPNPWPEVCTEAVILLQDLARPPAEMGIGLCVEPAIGDAATHGRWAAIHTHTGQMRMIPMAKHDAPQRVVETDKAFNARLPHVMLLDSAFLAPSDHAAPVVACLSVSSKPSQIEGFGEQYMPVLSFHTPNDQTEQLDPVVWCGTRHMPEQAQAASSRRTSPTARKKHPASSGRNLDAEVRNRRERAWLKDPVVHAHVPLPKKDARTAHRILPVSAHAGGGVLVFCEHSILYVPPPLLKSETCKQGAQKESKRRTREEKAPEDSMASQVASPKRRRHVHEQEDGDARDALLGIQRLVQVHTQQRMRVCSATLLTRCATPSLEEVLFVTEDGSMLVLRLFAAEPHTPACAAMKITRIGTCAAPADPRGLCYLGDGYVHVSSTGGDTTLLHISENDAVSEVHRWPNLGPIVDVVADCKDSEQQQTASMQRMITCSGTGPSCSLRVFWSGVSMTSIAALDLEGCLCVHAITDHHGATAMLALVFSTHTSLLQWGGENALEDVSDTYSTMGVPLAQRPLYIGAVHVTGFEGTAFIYATSARIMLLLGNAQCVEWAPPNDAEIVALDAVDAAVLVGLQGGEVVLLCVDRGQWAMTASCTVASEIASVAMSQRGAFDRLCAVGMWNPASFAVFSAHLAPIQGMDAVLCPFLPHSLLIQSFSLGACTNIMVGLANGTLLVYAYTHAKCVLWKELALGARPIQLACFQTGNIGKSASDYAVLAIGERSTILYAEGAYLRFSALRCTGLRSAAPMYLEKHAPGLVLVHASVLFVQLKSLRESDIETVPLHSEQATSIAHDAASDTIITAVWPSLDEPGASSSVHVFTRDRLVPVASQVLLRNERANCVASVHSGDDAFVVVGTGFQVGDTEETTAGRLIGFCVSHTGLEQVFALDVPGNVFGLVEAAGFLVAAVNARVDTYSIVRTNGAFALHLASRWGCAFMASSIAVGYTEGSHTLVIGDAMRSITVLALDAHSGQLVERARDLDPYWTSTVAMYDDTRQEYIASDIGMNVFVSARVAETTERAFGHAMRRTACFHYGDMLNRFVYPSGASTDPHCTPRVYFCTASGALGLICEIGAEYSEILAYVQQAMAELVATPGAIPWEEWRTLRTEHRVVRPTNFLDGDFIAFFLACTPAQRERIIAVAKHLARRKETSAWCACSTH
ncbi:hypothetical protein MVES_001712 [Malassezia vespertilionis]|uniref:DNA damage-binding protein 1 n=1 Tax=Malassezia vespertilionis TaxID=2020962 RepID=A0A2N1JD48_9BASI|nr:hypothetical protein MVES_001712 [Malassezia vespertilionis]